MEEVIKKRHIEKLTKKLKDDIICYYPEFYFDTLLKYYTRKEILNSDWYLIRLAVTAASERKKKIGYMLINLFIEEELHKSK